VLDERVEARRANNAFCRERLGHLPGLSFMPEAPGCCSTFWLTCIQIDPEAFGATREDLRLALEAANIESRPVWKPMHLRPVFAQHPVVGGKVAEQLFENGLCPPSGSSLSEEDRERVVEVILRIAER